MLLCGCSEWRERLCSAVRSAFVEGRGRNAVGGPVGAGGDRGGGAREGRGRRARVGGGWEGAQTGWEEGGGAALWHSRGLGGLAGGRGLGGSCRLPVDADGGACSGCCSLPVRACLRAVSLLAHAGLLCRQTPRVSPLSLPAFGSPVSAIGFSLQPPDRLLLLPAAYRSIC